MEGATKSGRGMLKASAVFFFLGVICLVVAIFLFIVSIQGNEFNVFILEPFIVGYMLSIILSVIFNLVYRKRAVWASGFSTFMLIVGLILLVFPVIMFIYLLPHMAALGSTLKTATVIGDDGREYKLTQKQLGSNEFIDQYGDLWITEDGGETFKRLSVKLRDEYGNILTLNPRFSGNDTYYQDENGNYWHTFNGGYSFERDNY